MPNQFHWLQASFAETGPRLFTEHTCDIDLPEGHTLRRFLVSQTLIGVRRNVIHPEDMYCVFASQKVTYGYTAEPVQLYNTTRRIPMELFDNPESLVNDRYQFFYAADDELGINEKVQRGGPDSFAQRIRLTWSLQSEGGGSGGDILGAGEAAMTLRALYSIVVP